MVVEAQKSPDYCENLFCAAFAARACSKHCSECCKCVEISVKQDEAEARMRETYSHVVKDKHLHTGDLIYRYFMSAAHDNQQVLTTKTIMGVEVELPAFTIHNVLSNAECQSLVNAVEKEPTLEYEFWNPEEPEKKDLRNVVTVEVQDHSLANVLWDRMKDHVVSEITVTGDEDQWEFGMKGTWRAVGINPILLFANYGPGNHFSPHTDGNNVLDFNHRSLYSVLVYLNTCDEGGGTLLFNEKWPFVADEEGRLRYPHEAMKDCALAKCGDVLVFSQEVPHEGEPVGSTSRKIIIRTDVMYERHPPICDAEHDREAFRLYQQATLLEGQKKFVEAAALYKQSCRLSEELARMLNIYGAF